MEFDVIEPQLPEQEHLDGRLEKRIQRLKGILHTYKHAKIARDVLIEISNLSERTSSLQDFYKEVHLLLKKIIAADNFYVASLCPLTEDIELIFFIDEEKPNRDLIKLENISELLKLGLTGYVIRTGQTLLCDRAKFKEMIAANEVKQVMDPLVNVWLGTPIIRGEQVLGALVVQSYQQGVTYSDSDIELMKFICQHIAGVSERIEHQHSMEQAITIRTNELIHTHNELKQEITERIQAEKLHKTLFEIASLCHDDLDDEHFYQKLSKILKQFLGDGNCYISLYDPENHSLFFPFCAQDDKNKQVMPKQRPFSDGLTEYLMKCEQALLLDKSDLSHLVEDKQIYQNMDCCPIILDISQWMAAPLYIDNQINGVLALYHSNPDIEYHESNLELLNFVAQQIAIAIERKRAAGIMQQNYQNLEREVKRRTSELAKANRELKKEITLRRKMELQLIYDANHDPLTGLPNRAMFMERLEQAISHIQRHPERQFALMFIDLDKFKRVNDTLGHIEGDRFLIETSDRLKMCVRQNDTLGRLGGDEFVVLLDSIQSPLDAIEIADRILQLLSNPYMLSGKKFYSSASIGIAISSTETEETEKLLRSADHAMYQAKAKGRGRYEIYQSPH
ncbi:diguanylate cyclase [Parashewanella curva]|uniref:Diguanylate cyclase n=1 Tax=Parashewanella curva TaxID=2338552 RepID=A0A3L8PWY9_9GAMM|nr:diguanylate cyclase [Parashewanella curva]RLV59967.1 diguanylate cyclase [Parashewanella curva]